MGKRKRNCQSEKCVDRYRQIWESDEHWEMRKEFIQKFQNSLNEDEICCLSQLYYNVKVLGCSYAPAVMDKLQRFVDDLPTVEKRKKCFVRENNVNEMVGNKEPQSQTTEPPKNGNLSSPRRSPRLLAASFFAKEQLASQEPANKPTKPTPQDQQPNTATFQTTSNLHSTLSKLRDTIKQIQQPVTNAAQLLGVALSKCHISFEWNYQFAPNSQRHEPTFECECLLDGHSLCRGTGKNKKSAKNDACQLLILKLDSEEWLAKTIPTKPVAKESNSSLLAPVVEKTVSPVDFLAEIDDPEESSGDSSAIDYEKLTTLVNKYRKKVKVAIRLLEFVVNICHYTIEWKSKLVSDTKPSNDFNFACWLLINGNKVGSGIGKNRKKAKVEAAKAFIDHLDAAKERKLAQMPPVSQQLPPKPEPVTDFVIMELPIHHAASAVEILRQSAEFNKTKVAFRFEEFVCNVALGGEVIAAAKLREDSRRGVIKKEAAQLALNFLKKTCFTVKMKTFVCPDSEVSKDEGKSGGVPKNDAKSDESLSSDNVGNKLLRLMGWTGGGLGKHGTGIKEPIKASNVLGRQGFGTEKRAMTTQEFHKYAQNVIRKYVVSDASNDLVFSSEFTNEERAVMHKIAHKFGLKTVSRGKGTDRFLVVSRKYSPDSLLKYLIESGGSTEKYELIPPTDGFTIPNIE